MAQVTPHNQKQRKVFRHAAGFMGKRLRTRVRLLVGAIVCVFTFFSLALVHTTAATGADLQMLSWMWAGLLIGAVCLSAVFIYTRKLLAPLEDVQQTAARIAGGRLDQPAEVTGMDETAALAELINDIAANQQEILLHLWTQTGNSIQVLDRLQAGIDSRFSNDGLAGMKKDLASIRSNMEGLRALVNGVEFFQVKLSNNKISAMGDPCSGEPCETDPSASVGSEITGRRSTAHRTRY